MYCTHRRGSCQLDYTVHNGKDLQFVTCIQVLRISSSLYNSIFSLAYYLFYFFRSNSIYGVLADVEDSSCDLNSKGESPESPNLSLVVPALPGLGYLVFPASSCLWYEYCLSRLSSPGVSRICCNLSALTNYRYIIPDRVQDVHRYRSLL